MNFLRLVQRPRGWGKSFLNTDYLLPLLSLSRKDFLIPGSYSSPRSPTFLKEQTGGGSLFCAPSPPPPPRL